MNNQPIRLMAGIVLNNNGSITAGCAIHQLFSSLFFTTCALRQLLAWRSLTQLFYFNYILYFNNQRISYYMSTKEQPVITGDFFSEHSMKRQ